MSSYRLYLQGRLGIIGRFDFYAENDVMALEIGSAICEACSDLCDRFEVWDHDRQVVRQAPLASRRLSDAAVEMRTVETEERLLASGWAVARSRRLLERYQTLRRG